MYVLRFFFTIFLPPHPPHWISNLSLVLDSVSAGLYSCVLCPYHLIYRITSRWTSCRTQEIRLWNELIKPGLETCNGWHTRNLTYAEQWWKYSPSSEYPLACPISTKTSTQRRWKRVLSDSIRAGAGTPAGMEKGSKAIDEGDAKSLLHYECDGAQNQIYLNDPLY